MFRTARFGLGRRWGAKAQSALVESAGGGNKAPYCNRFLDQKEPEHAKTTPWCQPVRAPANPAPNSPGIGSHPLDSTMFCPAVGRPALAIAIEAAQHADLAGRGDPDQRHEAAF